MCCQKVKQKKRKRLCAMVQQKEGLIICATVQLKKRNQILENKATHISFSIEIRVINTVNEI